MRDQQEQTGVNNLVTGCAIYWTPNEVGGRIYTTDGIDGGTFVWDTTLISVRTLLAVVANEFELRACEAKGGER